MSTLKKVLSLLTPHEKRRGLLVLVLVIGMALLEVAGVASVMPFLAVLGNPDIIETNQWLATLYGYSEAIGIQTTDQFLMLLGGLSFGLIVISAVYRSLTMYGLNRFIEMRRYTISSRLLETYLRQPYSFFLNRHSGDLSKTVLSEVDQLVAQTIRPTIMMIAYSFVVLAIVALLIALNPILAVAVAVAFSVMYGGIYAIIRGYLARIGQIRVSANKQRFTAAAEVLGGIKSIKVFGREHSYLTQFMSPSRRFSQTQAAHQTLNQVPKFLIEALAFGGIVVLTMFLLAFYGGAQSNALGQILPILGLYAFSAYRLQPAAQHIYQGMSSLRYSGAAIDNILNDIIASKGNAPLRSRPSDPLQPCDRFRLSHLTYRYPLASSDALHDINLTIPIGSSVGLVGSTGAGKTTLVDIILGLLSPTKGALLIDEMPVNTDNVRAWQKCLGYVPQEIFLTDTSVAENIALGIPATEIDQDQVVRCAKMAQVHEFIASELREGYNTLVGERGVRLSGGQRQRIGIARALYHNPEILVFDEATSALDTVTEQAVMQAVNALQGTKTIIMIAHRLSTVRNLDQIIMLEQGRVKAQGTYDELSAQNHAFRNFVGA